MNTTRLLMSICALAWGSPAIGQYLVDHQPYAVGGSGSDTQFSSASYPFTWQWSADDFRLTSPGVITHVNWWGFHVETFAPENETMRVRFYVERSADGLPGAILYEETFADPERMDTGRTIAIGGRPREYRYHVALASPLQLDQGVRYWFEVVQLGDDTSGFRFEYALSEQNGFAYRNNLVPDWTTNSPPIDLAFQLVVPEPVTGALLTFGLAFAAGLRARGRHVGSAAQSAARR